MHPIPDDQRCWFYVHDERSCDYCRRPARYTGLCAYHLGAVSPAERAVALQLDRVLS